MKKRAFRILSVALLLSPLLSFSTEPLSHELTGEVIEFDTNRPGVLLKHGPLDGVIEAGQTRFSLGKGDALLASLHKKVRGSLVLFDNSYRLEHLYPVDPIIEKTMRDINQRFRRDTLIRGRRAQREVGEPIPKFALYNQDGALVRPDLFSGKKQVINFIFTRCMEPTMCPAATQRMVNLQQSAAKAGLDKLHLLSISFDPEYDSPGILKEYALQRGIDNQNFDLLTGEKAVIIDVMRQFGILHYEEDGTINHTMATLIIDAGGRISYRKEGKEWVVEDFLKRLQES